MILTCYNDLQAIYKIFSDKEVSRFLPWFPLKTLENARRFYDRQFAEKYALECAYHHAICFKQSDWPIGYVNVCVNDSHDFGYGLCKEFWHRGIVTEAGKAVVEQLRKDRMPYITATHDVNNLRSGKVMKRLGMNYQYSYEERWQPKDILVTFRMYQLNLDWAESRVFKEYGTIRPFIL